VIALCCEVPGATRWDLAHREFSTAMRDEIRALVEDLVVEHWRAAAHT
jgi:hypothetical protein